MAVNKNFVVKNGLEVSEDLILADSTTRKVGIASTSPRYTLDVRGGIGVTDIYSVGVTTVLNELRVGTGGTVFSVIAGPTGYGQSVGIGTAYPAYLLDIRSPVSTGQTALYVQGDVRITGDLSVDDLTFDDATLSNLTVTEALFVGSSPGVSTFVGFTTFQDSIFVQDNLQVGGISTFIGFSTFQDSVFVQDNLQVDGITTFRNYAQFIDNTSLYFGNGADLNIYHDGSNSYIQEQGAGNLYIQSNGGSINIRTNSTENAFVANQDGSVELYYDNAKKFETVSVGATVTGTLFTNQLSSSGVATASAYYVDNTSVINNSRQLQNIVSLDATTTATIEAAIANAPNTFTELKVTGVSTFVGLATFNSGLQVVSGVTTLETVQISSGIVTATSGIVTYYGDGSYLTGNARNLTATIGIGTSGVAVGYGVSFIDFVGPGVSTVSVNSVTGIATITITGGGGGSASIGIGTTPGDAFAGIVTAGNLWYNSNLGRMFIYYQDQDSAQWVDASPSNVGVITSLINVSFSPGSAVSPSMYFVGDNQTGFFSPGLGQFTVVSTGSSVLNINPSGIRVTGVATAQDFDALSDINYKENINTVNNALLKVDQLRGVKFDWKESGLPSYGVIAQELEEVLPELVHGNDPKTVNYNGIIGVLIEAIKELKAEVEELKNAK